MLTAIFIAQILIILMLAPFAIIVFLPDHIVGQFLGRWWCDVEDHFDWGYKENRGYRKDKPDL